ncbi:MAG TPA: type III polyketide synthase [Ktedonobacterales bacterium]
MQTHPRITALATAVPPWRYDRASTLDFVHQHLFGAGWSEQEASRDEARQLAHIFEAAKVDTRYMSVDVGKFYATPKTTADLMRVYPEMAFSLGKEALSACLRAAPEASASSLTDFTLVSCTGYAAPGVDIALARELGIPPDARRVIVGHMGCYAAIVGLRQLLATARAYPDAVSALLSVEICSLHLNANLERDGRTMLALFGDGAAAAILSRAAWATGPELVDAYTFADFSAASQMSWKVSDAGFMMGLSPRVPVTLRRHVQEATERLLTPHGLLPSDITHWLIHPGGPSILEAIASRLRLSDEQLTHSWKVLRERGNCSSATVLMVLEEAMASGATKAGEWGVMMAFGPGLTLETALVRF